MLTFNINTESGFELHCEVVFPDGYLFEPAFNQGFIKFSKVGTLLLDEILQVVNSCNLCISGGGIDGVLPALFSECKYLLCDFIISFLVVCLLQKFFLQSHQLLIYFFGSAFVCVTNHLCYILLQLCLIGGFVTKQPVFIASSTTLSKTFSFTVLA